MARNVPRGLLILLCAAAAFIAPPHRCEPRATAVASPRRCEPPRVAPLRAAGDDDDVEDLIRRARALREEIAADEARDDAPGLAAVGPPGDEAAPDAAPLDDDDALAARRREDALPDDDVLAARRREAEALADALTRPPDKSAWPKFGAGVEPSKKPAPGDPAARVELTEEAMRDPTLQTMVRRLMIDAFDNYPAAEVETMYYHRARIFRRRVAATPRLQRGNPAETSRGDFAAAT